MSRGLRLGQQYLTLAYVDDGAATSASTSCCPAPSTPSAPGLAWAPVYSVTDLYRALIGTMNNDRDIVCVVHGDQVDDDRDDGPEDGAGFVAQELEVVGG